MRPGGSSRSIPTSRYWLFGILAVVGCAVDLVTKQVAFAQLGLPAAANESRAVYWLWEGIFGLETSVNQGALFGMGQGMSWLFGLISIVFGVIIVVWLFRFDGAEDLTLTIALGCVMAGVLGNLYDRLGMWHGADAPAHHVNGVRDWILFQINDERRWPNFNIADSLLVCGAGLLMLHAFRQPAEEPGEAKVGNENAQVSDASPTS